MNRPPKVEVQCEICKGKNFTVNNGETLCSDCLSKKQVARGKVVVLDG